MEYLRCDLSGFSFWKQLSFMTWDIRAVWNVSNILIILYLVMVSNVMSFMLQILYNMRYLRCTSNYGTSWIFDVKWVFDPNEKKPKRLCHCTWLLCYLEINQLNNNWVRGYYSGDGWLWDLVVGKSLKQIFLWKQIEK